MTEHRPPTPATVRYLYGVTSQCAFPGCDEPLFKPVDGLKQRQLNSTVAHIHARRSGGPRWDANMTEADNRAAENLLLLCLFHSSVIDAEPDNYPVETLREWKAIAQDGSGVVPAVATDEVQRILAMSISQEINLTADVIKLGGEGGGGAIGFGGCWRRWRRPVCPRY
jgi:hypothetical protein